MTPRDRAGKFLVIGENIHTTRTILRRGKLVTRAPSGEEAVGYTSAAGETRYLIIPEDIQARQDYQEGRVKHVLIAVRAALSGIEPAASAGLDYIGALVSRQVERRADYLDINVDEVSLRSSEQIDAMRRLTPIVEAISPVPLSIDSSSTAIIQAGLEACTGKAGRPLVNSASLDRGEALELAAARDLPVIVTAAGESGMPSNDTERVANASRMADAALAKGIPPGRIFIDALVFPISVDVQFGVHCLEAMRRLRERYGPEVHVTGGLSNVSFGLPARKLVNQTFIQLAAAHGADSGILDPVANDVAGALASDRTGRGYQLAEDMLLGRDPNCRSFLRAYRRGELSGADSG